MEQSSLKFRCGFCSRWIIALVIGPVTAASAEAVALSSLLGTPPVAIEIQAEPITAFDLHDPSQQRFGQLEFRGGLTLKSPYRGFGGLSALRFTNGEFEFVSLSDHGMWFTGRLICQGPRPISLQTP